jgi:hypothetical protein
MKMTELKTIRLHSAPTRESVPLRNARDHAQALAEGQAKVVVALHLRCHTFGSWRGANLMGKTQRPLIGVAIIAASLLMVFWWGVHFKVFGGVIRPNLSTAGFLFWIASGMFGVGYASSGVPGGLKASGCFILLVAVALALGVARGAYS